jgi:hypothetical protein
MNSCCALSVEQIAADQHKPEGECCLIVEHTPAPPKANCPVSQRGSRKVQQKTVQSLLRAELGSTVQNVQYYYCDDPTCEVVYFSNEEVPYFKTSNLKAKVFAKDEGDDVNVCYCFDWTRGRIRQQIAETGRSTASIEIAQKVKQGLCACSACGIKNPSGRCCLGDVNQVIKQSLKLLEERQT